ncbi:hypothetical protein D9M68_701630 [compost metagenome]
MLEPAACLRPHQNGAARPSPAAQRNHDRPRPDIALGLGQEGLQIRGASAVEGGIVLIAKPLQHQGRFAIPVRAEVPAHGQRGPGVLACPVQHGDHSQRQVLAQPFAGGLLDRRLQVQFPHPVAQRRQDVLAVLAFPQLGFRDLARRHVQKDRHDAVRPILAHPRFVPGLLGRRGGEFEPGRLARLHDPSE